MRGQKRKNHSTPSRSTAPTPSAAVLSPPPPLTAAGSRSSPPRHESPYSLDPEATPPHAAPPLPIPSQPLVATTAAAGGAKPACSSPRFESPSSVATVRNNQLAVAVGGWPQFEASLLLPRPIDPLWSPAPGTSPNLCRVPVRLLTLEFDSVDVRVVPGLGLLLLLEFEVVSDLSI